MKSNMMIAEKRKNTKGLNEWNNKFMRNRNLTSIVDMRKLLTI